MTLKRGFLASQVGRRLLLLFVIAAFVPIAAMMVIAFTRVDAALDEALQIELTQAAKSYGLQLLDRLVRIDGLLDDAALLIKGDSLPARLPKRLASNFAGVAMVAADGSTLAQVGSLPEGWHPDPALVAALGRGKTVAYPTHDTPSQLMLLRHLVDAAGRTRIVAAAVRLNDFWGGREDYPAKTDFCIATASDVILHCSRPIPSPRPSWSELTSSGVSSLRWSDDHDRLRASAYPLFLESRFVSGDWIVLAMQPESYALRASHSFRAAVIPAALLAVLIVLFVSTNQIRRTLVPLQNLLAGTLRLTRHDFNARIDVVGGDEFAQLARAFNDMAGRLGLNFRTLSAFADIDRSILTTLDLADIAGTANRCLKELTGVDLVSVALIEPGAP